MKGAARFLALAGGLLLVVAGASAGEAQQMPPDSVIRKRLGNDTTLQRMLQSGDTAALRTMAERVLGRPVSQAELLAQLRASGYSREQAKEMFKQFGMDPAAVDAYFDLAEAQKLDKSTPVKLPGLSTKLATDSLGADSTLAARADSAREKPLEVFGRSLFERASSEFQTVMVGPVDPDYRLGPGDEVVLGLTGSIILDHRTAVTSDGYLILPDIGRIAVNGLTLRQLRERLVPEFAAVYQGVGEGASSTAQLHISLGNLRRAQVYLVGEVEQPGAYQVSSLTSVFNALYEAGGPTESGSFRRIAVWRGDEVVKEIDLYDYLLRGDGRSDIRLEHGDRVFVPLAGPQVHVRGAVRRPAIYEMKEGESLEDVIRYAGGFGADAFARRVQIDRILPPDRRRPGIDRVLVDVDLQAMAEGEVVPVQNGDIVRVFPVSDERRHRVVVSGQVRRPGIYEWSDGMTLWSLLERAQGLEEEAYTPRAHIYRLNQVDGSRRLIRTPLLADSAGRPVQDVALAESDSIVIYSQEKLRNPTMVTIHGFVKNPGTYPLADGMTVQDLILAAGGFVHGAHQLEAEVARLPDLRTRNDTTAAVFRVGLAPAVRGPGEDAPGGGGFAYSPEAAPSGYSPAWLPSADEFELANADHVFVRKAPGYEEPATVTITGEVMLPGTYVLKTRRETVSDLLRRAGGLTQEGYTEGAQLVRKGEIVATNLDEALRNPKSRYNVALEPGDSIRVPKRDPTVLVTGAVAFDARVLFEPGEGLDYYISQAGGYVDTADKNRVSVMYQNGERATIDKLLLLRFKPDVLPGATIFVPERPAGAKTGIDWNGMVTSLTGMLGSLLALKTIIDKLNE